MKNRVFLIILLLIIAVILTQPLSVVAEKSDEWDFSEGVPGDYFVSSWVLQDLKPEVVIDIQEFIGSKEDEYDPATSYDFYRGVVEFSGISKKLIINQIPDYRVNYNNIPEGKDPNVICVTRFENFSSIYIRAKADYEGQSLYLSLLNSSQHYMNDDEIIFLEAIVITPNHSINGNNLKMIRFKD